MDKNITAVILTSNSEEVLEDCLRSLQGFAGKILVIDSGSTDKTVLIAKKYHAQVISHSLDNFAKQRSLAILHVKTDWIFYIDADEKLTPEFKKEALFKVSSYSDTEEIAGFFVRRKTFYFGKDWGLTDQVQRLFYKKRLNGWYGAVHETPDVDGIVRIIESPIIHNTHRNLSQMIEKTNKWSNYEAQLRLDANHPKMSWWRFPRVMVPEFFRSYIKEKGYKNGTEGMIESIYQAFSIFITYGKLWELQNKKK